MYGGSNRFFEYKSARCASSGGVIVMRAAIWTDHKKSPFHIIIDIFYANSGTKSTNIWKRTMLTRYNECYALQFYYEIRAKLIKRQWLITFMLVSLYSSTASQRHDAPDKEKRKEESGDPTDVGHDDNGAD